MGTVFSTIIAACLLAYMFYIVKKLCKSSKTGGCNGCCSGCKSSCKSLYTEVKDEHKIK